MKPEVMAMILRATDDAHKALISVQSIWQHHKIGTPSDHSEIQGVISSLGLESLIIRGRLEAALKCGANRTTSIPIA